MKCMIAFAAALAAVCAHAAPYICTPTSNSIAFGSYNPLTTSPDTDGTGTFVIACLAAVGLVQSVWVHRKNLERA